MPWTCEKLRERCAGFTNDEKKEPYARLPIDGRNMTVAVLGREFRRWLTRAFFTDTGTAPGSEALTRAIGSIEAAACYSGKEHELFNRVAGYDGAIWYDLGDGEAVKISAGNWEIVKDSPILFRRRPTRKLTTPEGSGGIFSTLAKATVIKPNIHLDELPRMAGLMLKKRLLGMVLPPRCYPYLMGVHPTIKSISSQRNGQSQQMC